MYLIFTREYPAGRWAHECNATEMDVASKIGQIVSGKGYRIAEIHVWHVQTENIPEMVEFLARKE